MTIKEAIQKAIIEDIGDGDHTSLACISENAIGKAQLLVKEEGILAGIEIAKSVFNEIDSDLVFTSFISDGANIKPGDIAFTIEGKTISILSGERLALNFMQRMSGIASSTNKLVSQIKGSKTQIIDTRKTTPNMRIFEKMAVKIGGGGNHRFGLYDMIMIKDNHVDFSGGITKAIDNTISYLKKTNKKLKIEIEVRNIIELNEAMKDGRIDRIMLDNFSPVEMEKAIRTINGKFETEASGGITHKTINDYAATGVDYISVGALTHQIKSLDLSLKAINF